jgi:ABC-type transport system involved in cytochrome bd biosynthesis, ATPase and permease components
MRYDKHNPPKVETNGTFAYVEEKPWILNATVKDNILFEQPMQKELYADAVKYSCLEQDLKVLIRNDETEIGDYFRNSILLLGEKGVNLSGGQKARVSLARAIYMKKDIYLLDDPLR